MVDIERDNFLYWYEKASQEEIEAARKNFQDVIDRLLIKNDLSPANLNGCIFSETIYNSIEYKVLKVLNEAANLISERMETLIA